MIAPSRIVRTEGDRARLLDDVRAMPLDKPLRVEIRRHRERRTLDQNSLHWLDMTSIAKEATARLKDPEWQAAHSDLEQFTDAMANAAEDVTGYTAEQMHEFMKRRFCPVKRLDILGETVAVQSTTMCDTQEMATMRERIVEFAAKRWGIVVDDPIPARVREHENG